MQKHKILALLAVFFFITISATDIFAFEEKGKINIYLEESKNSTSLSDVSDVEFKLVKVANLRNGTYNYVEELDNLNLADLNNLNTADALKSASNEISTAVAKKNIDGIFKKTDQYGYAQFNNLENGVYLLQATDINKYDNITPTIVAIPSFDNSTNSTNGMNYVINVIPKHTPIIAAKTGDNSVVVIPVITSVITLAVIYSLRKELKVC